MTEEEIKLKIEEQEKKEKRNKIIKKVLIILGSILLIGLLILIGNVDYFVSIKDENKYLKENNYYLRNIKQDVYSEGNLKLDNENVIRYFIYTFNATEGGRDYLVVFWNMKDEKYEIKYKELSTVVGPNDTSAFVVNKDYSDSKAGFINYKDFLVSVYSAELKEYNNESSYNTEKTCISKLPIDNILIILDENSYIKNSIIIDKEEYCQENTIGSYIIIKK